MTGPCLRDLRHAAGLTQADLARRVPCHWRTVARWEQGGAPISRAARARLLDVFADVAAERHHLQEVLRRWQPT